MTFWKRLKSWISIRRRGVEPQIEPARQPFSKLECVVIFTESSKSTVSPLMLLYIQKMAQEPIEKIQNRFPFHVISNSAIPRVSKQLSTVSDDVLFSEIVHKCPDLVERLKVGFVHGVAQFFQESNSTHGVVMLFYRTSKEEKSSHRRSYLNELFATHVMDGNYYDPAEHTIVSPLNIVNPTAIEESFSETASLLSEKAQQSGSSFSIYFGFVDSPHLAAWTYRCEQDLYLVCISTGTYVRLRALFHILSFAAGFNTVTNVGMGSSLRLTLVVN